MASTEVTTTEATPPEVDAEVELALGAAREGSTSRWVVEALAGEVERLRGLVGEGAGNATPAQHPAGVQYAGHETEVNRIAQVIVDAGCKPYAAAEALLAAGVRLRSAGAS